MLNVGRLMTALLLLPYTTSPQSAIRALCSPKADDNVVTFSINGSSVQPLALQSEPPTILSANLRSRR